ncbi:glycine betaine ABC transporter substrate-binding protein [Demequina sp.]|uniref:glycine betaine ABC transporter substrate-binding protein n=1 Tax=Demequina sp. TaxID=2050685 RepID=UPI0025BAF959|nr:glycine betaine ABC transporter substrate-binding protein [Demequina sp.]
MKMRSTALLATAAAASLVLAGCSSSPEADPTTSATGGGDAPAAGGDITMAVFNGWDESLATSLLWQNILDSKGYNVTLEYADPAPVFQAVADGDYDLVTDVWSPTTHASYLEEYGDNITKVGAWFDNAALTVVVNADAPVDSLADLADNADAFGNRIVGIEPGAGLTAAMQDSVIPTYGLGDMDFITSSTPAMLAELDTAMANGENIAVTLWEPHWVYGAYDVKNLEDPESTLGVAEQLVTYSRTGFGDDFPEVNTWLANFKMDGALLADLENKLRAADSESAYEGIVNDWVAANQEWVDSLTA